MRYMNNIVHLSTGHAGGAGLAARRLNEALNSHGIPSTFMAIEKTGFFANVNEVEIKRHGIQKITSAINTRIQNNINQSVSVTLSSSRATNLGNMLSKLDERNTILQVHNWFNLLSFQDLRAVASSKFRVVFTMHDQRLFTGGCHYSFDCRGYETSCSNCPLVSALGKTKVSRNHLFFQEMFSIKNKFIFTAPSRWMVDKAKKSSILSGHEILLTPNVLGPTFLDDVSVNPIAEIEGRKIRVGVASGDPNSFTKGGDLVQTIANYPFLEVVFLKDYTESRHGEFWNYIDTLFLPSRADNSPNVILEANAFGVPIVAARVGGIPENLSSEFDSLFEMGVDQMDYVVRLIKESATRKSLKIMVTPSLQKSREASVINDYAKIYENLILKYEY
jgi:hypothetical protein